MILSKKKAAREYHQDYVQVNVAKGLELAQLQRGSLLSSREYAEVEAAALLVVYMVHLEVSGIVDDEMAQARIMDRARKLAQERLDQDLEVEVTEAD